MSAKLHKESKNELFNLKCDCNVAIKVNVNISNQIRARLVIENDLRYHNYEGCPKIAYNCVSQDEYWVQEIK